MEPLVKVDGKPLGSNFWKVFFLKAKRPNASLERPHQKIRTVGEAVGCAIAWRSCDVCYDKTLLFHVIGAYISILFSCIFFFKCLSRNKVCNDEQARCNILGSAEVPILLRT
ncbi:hypothetical protein RHGRI_014208 [Rhododendron griersonianum]|uniref:Uncharacterized protein n=1 Tax=Rhododendron griersonianum TaxID=479676 RepID=A0AAV6K901_9ERIC|nr:hypothetical protein RHGRI_014208 [Rhododendron griersonianum]